MTTITCIVCGARDDLRMGVCFDCATDGDIRLAKKSTLQHWSARRLFGLLRCVVARQDGFPHGVGAHLAHRRIRARP